MLVRLQSNRSSHSLKVGMQNGTDMDSQMPKQSSISSQALHLPKKKINSQWITDYANAKLLDDNMLGGQTHKMEKC